MWSAVAERQRRHRFQNAPKAKLRRTPLPNPTGWMPPPKTRRPRHPSRSLSQFDNLQSENLMIPSPVGRVPPRGALGNVLLGCFVTWLFTQFHTPHSAFRTGTLLPLKTENLKLKTS